MENQNQSVASASQFRALAQRNVRDRRLLAVIARESGGQWAELSTRRIAAIIGLSQSSVAEAIQRLAAAGLLEIDDSRRDGNWGRMVRSVPQA